MTFYGGLDERKRKILRAIIDDYIKSAEPVGSRTIVKRHELGFSSATIRNEMADLEEMGYLGQPHTSAGRIPLDKGYRFYVDQLLKIKNLSSDEISNIKRAMEVKINELNQIIKNASILMSELTNYTSLATAPQMKRNTIKAIQLVPIDAGKALLILVTDVGLVRNSLIKIKEDIAPEFLIKMSNILNEKLSGKTLEDINVLVIKDIEKEMGQDREMLMSILDELVECIRLVDDADYYLEGATNILNFPEFKSVEKAKDFLDMLEEKKILYNLMNVGNQDSKNINIQIGKENNIENIKGCSLITTTYSVGDIVIGSIGIIGPTRMEYGKVISTIEYIRKIVNEEINKFVDDKSI